MRLARVLGAVGRAMIAAGVLILLFVGYQLWGTGLQTDRAQADLGERFQALQAESTPASTAPAGSVATTPGGTLPAAEPSTAAFPAVRPGDPIGRITIDAIGVDFYIVEGVDLRWLEEGPGHFPNTPFPGQPGNAALAGHRTTYKAPFNRIDELRPGDLITVETVQGTFTYQVKPQPNPEGGPDDVGYYIVSPDALSILDQADGVNELTLMACHPKYNLTYRIVVKAEMVGNPVAANPVATGAATPSTLPATDAFGGVEGGLLVGDSSARLDAVLWSLAAAAIWFLAWLVARRLGGTWRAWQTWLAYALALPFFAVTLYLAFENINRLLPAAY